MSETTRSKFPIAVVGVPLVIVLCGLIPRVIVGTLGLENPWTAFLYQYLMGGLVFVIGLFVIRRSGACDFSRPGDRKWFGVLVFGYVWYAAMHAVLIALAISIPFRGTTP